MSASCKRCPARVPASRWTAAIVSVLFGLGTSGAHAQPVTLSGRLQIGFSDPNNQIGFPTNSAMPRCAGAGTLVNTGPAGTTLGTLLFNGVGSAEPGVGGAITFHAVGGGFGGAQQKAVMTCAERVTPFDPWWIRSRTHRGSAHFPGRKGKWTPMIATAPVPTAPTATYRVSAGGGNPHPITVTAWTTTDESNPPGPAGTTVMNTFTGSAFEQAFLSTSGVGVDRVRPGPARFGGGIPFSGGTGVQLGLQLSGSSPSGGPPTDFGQGVYVEGFLPLGPGFIGTDRKGLDTTNLSGSSNFTPPPFTKGLRFRRQTVTVAARTPGGTTRSQHGAIRTFNGGNTRTPLSGTFPPGMEIVSPVEVAAQNFEWTTGAVTHSDQIGDFRTVRRAEGYDVSVMASTAVAGETRRLQLVSPWSATIKPIGVFGLPVATVGVGGVAVLQLSVIPAPEPGVPLGLAFGTLLVLVRRRSTIALSLRPG